MHKHVAYLEETNPRHFKIEYDQDGDAISNVKISHGGSVIVIEDMETARDFHTAFGMLFNDENMKIIREEAAALGITKSPRDP